MKPEQAHVFLISLLLSILSPTSQARPYAPEGDISQSDDEDYDDYDIDGDYPDNAEFNSILDDYGINFDDHGEEIAPSISVDSNFGLGLHDLSAWDKKLRSAESQVGAGPNKYPIPASRTFEPSTSDLHASTYARGSLAKSSTSESTLIGDSSDAGDIALSKQNQIFGGKVSDSEEGISDVHANYFTDLEESAADGMFTSDFGDENFEPVRVVTNKQMSFLDNLLEGQSEDNKIHMAKKAFYRKRHSMIGVFLFLGLSALGFYLNPDVWEAFKRFLMNREISIEALMGKKKADQVPLAMEEIKASGGEVVEKNLSPGRWDHED